MKLNLMEDMPKWHMRKSFAVLAAASLFFIAGCSKSPNDLKTGHDLLSKSSPHDHTGVLSNINVKVEKNTLHFIDTATFFSDAERILAMSAEEFSQFEKEVGFKSLETVLHEAYEAFDGLRTNDDLRKWQNTYRGVAEWKDSTVVAVIQEDVYHRLVNKNGEYSVGTGFNKVTSEKVISVVDGDRSKAISADKLNESQPSNGILVTKLGVQQAAEPIFKAAAEEPARCGQQVLTNLRQDGDRKTWVSYYVTPVMGLYTVHTLARVRANGHKKTLFGWNKYKTKYRIDNITFSIRNANNEIKSFSGASGGNGSDQYEYAINFALGDEKAVDQYYQPSGFITAGARATSRGTTPYWAVVCCGTPCASNYGHHTF